MLWCQALDQDHWDRVFKFHKVNHDIEEFEETCGIYQRKEDEASYFMTVNPIVMLKVNLL